MSSRERNDKQGNTSGENRCDVCGDTFEAGVGTLSYTAQVMDHFMNPRNIGTLENPDGMGTCGDPSCGDCLVMHLRIQDNIITAVRYLVLGCAAAIASSSITSVLADGKTLETAATITDEVIDAALGGLPEAKRHCSLLGAKALQAAIADYLETSRRNP